MTNVDRRHFLKTTGALGLTPLSSPKMNSTMSIKRTPLGIRDDFAVTQNQTYLNTSYVGPFPTVVHEAAIKYANEQQLTPAKGLGISMEIKEATRVKFAELFGATRDEVALLFSTSDAENIVTSAIDLKAGDNVVIDELHFITSFVLYRWLEQAKGIELRIVPHTKTFGIGRRDSPIATFRTILATNTVSVGSPTTWSPRPHRARSAALVGSSQTSTQKLRNWTPQIIRSQHPMCDGVGHCSLNHPSISTLSSATSDSPLALGRWSSGNSLTLTNYSCLMNQ